MKSTQQMLADSRERAFLNRCKTTTTTFIGGLVVGIVGGLLIGAIFIDLMILK